MKVGMTQIFTPEGTVIPVTVVEAGPCTVIRKKDVDNDGYSAVCVGFGDIREKLVNKPKKGEFAKAGVAVKRYIREFQYDAPETFEIGSDIKADIFQEGDFVDVSGLSIGKGYQGVIRRWNQSRGPMTHGSKYHRGVGSMGSSSFPSRVFPGKKMAGQMGSERVTIQNLKVVRVDADKNMLLIRGAVPGKKGTLLEIREAIKK